MELLDKVKTDLEKNKNYDFESDFWTDEILCVLYDAVYATEQTIKDKVSSNKNIELEAEKHVVKMNGINCGNLFPETDETIGDIGKKDFIAGYEFAKHSI